MLASPWVGAVWETFVFAQLRHRERLAGRAGSLYFWRDRTREVDFVVDIGGRVELYEAKWAEVPSPSDAVNLTFARAAFGTRLVAATTVVARPPNPFPLDETTRAVGVDALR